MKKRSTYRPRQARAPMLVAWHTTPELGITERISVDAIRGGWATTDHFDNLADCRDIMALANRERKERSITNVCELAYHALLGIKQRHARTGKVGATGEEIAALVLLVDASEDFWKRQGGSTFARHYEALRVARLQQPKEAASCPSM